jgi:hypothetical protein
MNQGGAMTEYSSAFDQDGKIVSHPLIVPTLTKQEVDLLKMGGEPTPEIYRKAQDYAQQRMGAGQSTFATPQIAGSINRTHSDEQVAQIASSIKEFGWTNPILVDGENGIIAGHGRLMAAQGSWATKKSQP